MGVTTEKNKVLGVKSERRKFQRETKELVDQVFLRYPPKWFMTIIWNDFPRDPITCVSHSRHFKNVFLFDLYRVSKVKSIPNFPHRLGMVFFHERKELVVGGRNMKVFHTHIHLYNDIDNLTSSLGGHPKFNRDKLNLHVCKLFKGDNKGLRGMDVREWISDFHSHYNYKDLYNYRHEQDGDLVLDYENSDLPKTREMSKREQLYRRKKKYDELPFIFTK